MRRGQAEFLEWFPRLVLLLIAVIIIALLVRYFSNREFDASRVHRETYLARLYYDDLLMRSDETGRVYPGVLDYTKFESSTLNDRYGRTGKIAAKLTLTGCRQKTIWHDQELYRLKEPFAQTIGPGAATRQELLIPVSIWQAGTVCPGKLNITVVRPNS